MYKSLCYYQEWGNKMRKLMQQHEPNSRGRCVEDGGDGEKMDEWPVVARKQAHS